MATPKFEVGAVVVATCDFQPHLTEGNHYTVVEYTPSLYAGTFTWPACVTVVGDTGKHVSGHVHRFQPLEEPCSAQ